MATAGSLLNEFVSQNAIILIAGVITTVIAIAASTYFIARNYMNGNIDAGSSEQLSEERPAASEATSETTDEEDSHTHSADHSSKKMESEEGTEVRPNIDPVYYCEHIQGEIKRVQQDVTTRKICAELSPEQIAEERQRQQDQLAEIFKLMAAQEEKFGISSMDEMKDQMRLYADLN